MNPKPGYRTTEFWTVGLPGIVLTILTALQTQGLSIPVWSGPVMAVLYALSRGLAKINLSGR